MWIPPLNTPIALEKRHAKEDDKLYGKLDLNRIAIAGHSFGAWTTMAAGGMTVGGKLGARLNDTRILCMIPLSPPVVERERMYKATYSTLDIPALFMTGTLDTSVVSNTTAKERLEPYKHMPGVSAGGPPKYLINFDGADHMTFGGETQARWMRRKADPKTDPVFHGLILQSTTAFLDAYLLEDADAMAWLNKGDFVEAVGKHGKVEMDAEK